MWSLILLMARLKGGNLLRASDSASRQALCTVCLKIEIHEIQNLRNAVWIINKNRPSATKSTLRKLSNSNVSRHENEKLPRNPVLLTKSTHSHAFSREHSTRILRRLQSHQQSMYAGVSVSIGA